MKQSISATLSSNELRKINYFCRFSHSRIVFFGSNLESFIKKLQSNLEEVTRYFRSSTENTWIVYSMMVLSTLIISVGLNFSQSMIIYLGLLISPFIFSIIQLILSLFYRDKDLLLKSLSKLVLGSLLTVVVGILYFQLTPFAYSIKEMILWSYCESSSLIVLFFLGFSVSLFDKMKIPLIVWMLKLLMKWSLYLVLIGFSILNRDFEINLLELIISNKLLYLSFFVGMITALFLLKLSRGNKTEDSFQWFYDIIIFVSFSAFLYLGYQRFSSLVTQYNTEQYIDNELKSSSFVVNNYTIDKSKKEVLIFYTGIKPASTQNVDLKKKYHISGYHIEFKEFR